MAILKKIPEIWTERVRKAWDLPENLSVSEWADRSRVLDPMSSAEPGQWRTSRTPYLKDVMDAFNDPFIEDITIMASTQVGKTETLMNCLGYAIDQDPAPSLWVQPRENDVKSFSSNRVRPMIQKSPDLARHLTKDHDDVTKLEIKLDRMAIYFAGSNSPAGLASRPIRYLFLDETDKYPRFSGREADPIKLATERTRTFWNRKVVKCSTPTTKDGYVFREFQKTDQRRYHVPCSFCQRYQVLKFQQVKWPDDECDPDVIEEKKLAYYECEYCNEKITDNLKQRMLFSGQWLPKGCSINKYGKVRGKFPETSRRGFWINCLYSPWLTFSEIAAEFLRSKDSVETLMNFVNSWLAEPFQERIQQNEPDKIKAMAKEYEKHTVPSGVVLLTAGVDVQKDHLYCVIRGWGKGQESWLIRAERVEDWDYLADVLFQTRYKSLTGPEQEHELFLACIDTGYRTDEVYEFCLHWQGLARPIKGMSVNSTGIPIKSSTIERLPGTGSPIIGGLKLWSIDSNYFKDKVARLIQNSQSGNGVGFHLYQNPSKDYCRQMCSEHKAIIRDKRKGMIREQWQKVGASVANHYWDCEVYAAAAAHMLRVYDKSFGQEQQQTIQSQESDKQTWIPKRQGWINRR